MFKNMTHTYKITNIPFDNMFVANLFTFRNETPINVNCIIHTNKLINSYYTDTNIEEYNRYMEYYTVPQKIVHINLFTYQNAHKKIIFPKKSHFATYEYYIPNITLSAENTFLITGSNPIGPINISFLSYNHAEKYNIHLTEQLLDRK